jgi:hypothetical protein
MRTYESNINQSAVVVSFRFESECSTYLEHYEVAPSKRGLPSEKSNLLHASMDSGCSTSI